MTDDLARRVAELEALLRSGPTPVDGPARRFDPTEHMTMPRNAMAAMIAADVGPMNAEDRRAASSIHERRGALPEVNANRKGSGSGSPSHSATNGWREATPLGPQPGIALVDQIAESFAQRDRRRI